MPRAQAQAAQGAVGHALAEGGPGQPGQQVGGPAAHVLGPVVQRGFEQRLIGQADPSASTATNMARSGPAASHPAATSSRAAPVSRARSAAR